MEWPSHQGEEFPQQWRMAYPYDGASAQPSSAISLRCSGVSETGSRFPGGNFFRILHDVALLLAELLC